MSEGVELFGRRISKSKKEVCFITRISHKEIPIIILNTFISYFTELGGKGRGLL